MRMTSTKETVDKDVIDDIGALVVSADCIYDKEPLIASSCSQLCINSKQQQLVLSSSTKQKEVKEIVITSPSLLKNEKSCDIFLQILFPFFVAGLGTVAAGSVLDQVQTWKVFTSISELFILVPALLGLKGNLEMTLASRLSTAANLGYMDRWSGIIKICIGNLLLTQVQAIVVGLLASLLACVFALIKSRILISFDHAVVLFCSAMIAASLASAILSVLMIIVILLSKKFKLNPDNIATPVAASLGDLVTITLLAYISLSFYNESMTRTMLSTELIIGVIMIVALLPLFAYLCYKNDSVSDVLINGWTPILIAMTLSSLGGLILDKAQEGYSTFAAFSPMVNGIGGNLVAIQTSRICTYLHAARNEAKSQIYQMLNNEDDSQPQESASAQLSSKKYSWIEVHKRLLGAFNVYENPHAKCALVLISFVIPGDLFFVWLQIEVSSLNVALAFYPIFIAASFLQVLILLIVADWLVHVMWKLGQDPDNCTIPYLTALGDLVGTGFLLLGYLFLSRSNI